MTLTCYDSSTWTDIPKSAEAVLLYIDGLYKAPMDAPLTFPNLKATWWITIWDEPMAQVIDVENGDATPAKALEWSLVKRQMGATPIVYCNDSTWPEVKRLFDNAKQFWPLWWEAAPGKPPVIEGEAWARQYAWPPHTGGHYDLSIVPYMDPNPPITPEEAMGLSIAIGPDGSRHVAGVGADSREGHALVFSETKPGANTYTAWDITALIHNQYPDQPLYTVQA